MAKPDGGSAFCRTCGVGFAPNLWQVAKSDRECPQCKRARQNARNQKRDLSAYSKAQHQRPEVKARVSAYHQRKRADAVYLLKRRARRLLAYAVEKGVMVRQPCDRCGAVKVDGHHHDYSKPLDVRWLCRRCHFADEGGAA